MFVVGMGFQDSFVYFCASGLRASPLKLNIGFDFFYLFFNVFIYRFSGGVYLYQKLFFGGFYIVSLYFFLIVFLI
jgi:hypothetical protein